MSLQFAAVISGVFLLAGFVKGVVGLGLPTVSIGLLTTAMPPSRAAAIVVLPAIITNLWQSFAGPYLRPILKRLWPLFVGTCIGTWSAADLMAAQYAEYGVLILGLLLLAYALIGLKKLRFVVSSPLEKWIGGVTGLTTGIICAATGIQVVPSTPVFAGDRTAEGRASPSAWSVLYLRYASAGFQSHKRWSAKRLSSIPCYPGIGLRVCRDVHRPDCALSHGCGSFPEVVSDRNGIIRLLPRNYSDLFPHDQPVNPERLTMTRPIAAISLKLLRSICVTARWRNPTNLDTQPRVRA
jgi:hypothetical protein